MSSPKRQTLPLLPLCHCNGNWREPATVIRAIIVAIAEPSIGTAEMISDARAQGMSAFVWLTNDAARVKSGKAQTEQMFSGLCLKADARRL
jgi:hypothetical protein